MLAAGFLPDVISSDVHVISIEGPAFDLLHTLGKFHALGMTVPQLVASATLNPARAIRQPELGTLKPGVGADASILRVIESPTTYTDVEGVTIQGSHRWESAGLVLSGAWWTASA
jgi:dihydroorotase